MKLLFFTDTHIRATNPRNRLDNFYESILKKLEEIRDYANREKVDYVIHGGDLFDRPDSAIKPTGEVGKILASFNMPIYIVAGNHDIFGYNKGTLNRSMLGLLDSLSILRLIPDEGIELSDGNVKVLLLGKDYTSDLDLDKNNYIVKRDELKTDADYIINIVHGFLTDRPFLKHVPHILVGEVLDTDADITLSGHYHTGFPTQIHNGKYFSNPGSMVRITNSLAEINRKPKYIAINIDENGISLEDRSFKSAKSGEDVLDRKTLVESQFKEERLTIFSDSIHQNVDLEAMDLESMLNSIAMNEGFDIKVRNEAKDRLDRAKEIVNDRDR
ncbi:MAG: metallophosphoesterase [Neofamilia sp.]